MRQFLANPLGQFVGSVAVIFLVFAWAILIGRNARAATEPKHHYKIVQKRIPIDVDGEIEWSSDNRAVAISCTSHLAYCAVLIEVQ